MNALNPLEIWEDPDANLRYYLVAITDSFISGALTLKPNAELPHHDVSGQTEDLVQLAGQTNLTLFSDDGSVQTIYNFGPGNNLHISKAQRYTITNVGQEESVIVFRLAGDPREWLQAIRHSYVAIDPTSPQTV